jgi:hypothetical protein
MDVCSKAEFAALLGVTRGRVSQWLAGRRIDGDAIVGEGRTARINVKIARRQLQDRLDLGQRLGANGRAQLASPDPTEAAIKGQRLAALELANEKARIEAARENGRYVEADAVRQEMGAIAGRMVSAFEGCLPAFADAVAASTPMAQRDALHLLRGVWRAARARLGGSEAEELETVVEAVQ